MAKKNHYDEGGLSPVAEINITPMVDVMLVLLIIFMVTSPLMMSQLPVTLPKASSTPSENPKEPTIVSIDALGNYFIDAGDGAGPIATAPTASTASTTSTTSIDTCRACSSPRAGFSGRKRLGRNQAGPRYCRSIGRTIISCKR